MLVRNSVAQVRLRKRVTRFNIASSNLRSAKEDFGNLSLSAPTFLFRLDYNVIYVRNNRRNEIM